MRRPISGNVWLESDVDVEDADDATVIIETEQGRPVTVYNAKVRVYAFGSRKFMMFDGMTEADA